MTDCLFCKIVNKEILATVVYEDDDTLAMLDIHPVNPGHVLVLPKVHTENMLTVDDPVLSRTMAVVRRMAHAVQKAMNAEGINLAQNNGTAAGQAVMHLHFHVIPRHPNDGRELWHGSAYALPEEMNAIADQIKKSLA